MKKISKIALVAVVAAMTAFFGCNSEASILEQVAPVSDLQAKAFPGLNVVTWKPNAVSNGYTLFANYGNGWVSKGQFSSYQCSYEDFISIGNEWANGQEVKYMIQNSGNSFLQRAAYVNKELVSSEFVEVSVNAVNPGYKAEVMYKVPAIEEGKSVPDFFNFDYSNAEEIANLVEPTATIETIGLETFVKDFTAAPYLNYFISVRTPDESDEIEFAWESVDYDDWNYRDFEWSKYKKETVVTPFVGTNDIYVKIEDGRNYYTPKIIKIGSVEVEQETKYNKASDFNVEYIADDETVEFTWKPVTNIDGSVTEGVNYSIYYKVDGSDRKMFKKVPVTPVYDDFDCLFVASAAYADDMKGKLFYLYASKDNKKISENIASDTWSAKEITAPWNKDVSFEVVAAHVDANKEPYLPKTIKLVFEPYKFNDKYTNKVTYKVYEKVVQKSPADKIENADDIDWTLTDITADYDNVTKKMVTSSISPKGVTYYLVVAFNAATNVKEGAYNEVQFWSVAGPTTPANDPYGWNVAWDGKECEISGGNSGAANGKAFTIPTFEAYQIKTAVKELGKDIWASSVATKATVKIVKEDAADDGNIPYSLKITAADEAGYTVYIYKVEEVDGEKVYSEKYVITN